MTTKQTERGAFECECGKAYATAAKFSDHVHNCNVNPVEWKGYVTGKVTAVN